MSDAQTCANDYVEIGRSLPCGCLVRNRAVCSHDSETTDDDTLQLVRKLNYWFSTLVARHKCELVSAENPCGVTPRKG